VTLHAPLHFQAAPATKPNERPFAGIAYAGEAMNNGSGTFVVDLATLKAVPPLPLLFNHDQAQVVGVIDTMTRNGTLEITGRLFLDGAGREISDRANAGIKWELSVGVFLAAVRSAPSGKLEIVNGRTLTGPFQVLENGHLREVSVVAVGADPDTRLDLFRGRTLSPRDIYAERRGEPARVDLFRSGKTLDPTEIYRRRNPNGR